MENNVDSRLIVGARVRIRSHTSTFHSFGEAVIIRHEIDTSMGGRHRPYSVLYFNQGVSTPNPRMSYYDEALEWVGMCTREELLTHYAKEVRDLAQATSES